MMPDGNHDDRRWRTEDSPLGWAKPTGPAFGRPDDRLRVPTAAEPGGHARKSPPLPTLGPAINTRSFLRPPSSVLRHPSSPSTVRAAPQPGPNAAPRRAGGHFPQAASGRLRDATDAG